MNTDYTYCLSEECIHRRGCKRALCNYTEQQKNDLVKQRCGYVSLLVPFDCIHDHDLEDKYGNWIPTGYNHLDRFRNSDGTEMKNDTTPTTKLKQPTLPKRF